MLNRKSLAILAVLTTSATLLSGCGNDSAEPVTTPAAEERAIGFVPSYGGVYYETLPDGYNLLCVYAGAGAAGGPSCDWAGYNTWLEAQNASQ